MKNITILFLLFLFVSISAQEKISYESEDGLTITADLYAPHEKSDTPFIVLFHQASWSRGEYIETAKWFNGLGFNVMAVDQRSGKQVNEVKNETAERAAEEGKKTAYIDAYPDILASLKYAEDNYPGVDLIALGSSYSAALVLKAAGEYPELVDGVLAFSPGEYFEDAGKPADWITSTAANIDDPVFITSAKNEESQWRGIFEAVETEDKTGFVPETEGQHGSRALWIRFEGHEEYRKAVKDFLEKHYK